MLRELLLRRGDDPLLAVEQDGAGRGRALVDGEDEDCSWRDRPNASMAGSTPAMPAFVGAMASLLRFGPALRPARHRRSSRPAASRSRACAAGPSSLPSHSDGVLLLVQPRAAAAVGRWPARRPPACGPWSSSISRGEPVHRFLRREGAGVHVADLLPPELRELRIVRHVDAGRRPVHAVGRAVELDQAAELRRALGERLVPDRASRG